MAVVGGRIGSNWLELGLRDAVFLCDLFVASLLVVLGCRMLCSNSETYISHLPRVVALQWAASGL